MANSNKSLFQELEEIGLEFNLNQGQGFCSASNFGSGFSNASKSKNTNLNAETSKGFSKITNKSLLEDLAEIELEFNLDQGKGFSSAANFNSGFNSAAKSKSDNLNSECANGFSKPLQSTSFAPAVQFDGFSSGFKSFKPAADVNKENDMENNDTLTSDSNLPIKPHNASFFSAGSIQNNNIQPHKLPLSTNSTNSKILPSITKPKLKPVQTNPNQVSCLLFKSLLTNIF
jgi:hypothetical protein